MSGANRRSSANLAERKDIGDPYQIYSEVSNAGKNLQGSKKKVKWLFGFSDSNEEYEVTLLHSVVSGKKTIYENGREIVSSTNMMSTEFSHGWSSPITYRLYRIEIAVHVTSDHDYIFSIDGQPFNQLPDKVAVSSRRPQDIGRYGNEPQAAVNTKRSSVSTVPSGQASNSSSSANSTSFNRNDNPNFQPSSLPHKRASSNSTSANIKSGFTVQNSSAATSLFDKVDSNTNDNVFTASFDAFGDEDSFATGAPAVTSTQKKHVANTTISAPLESKTRSSIHVSSTPVNKGQTQDIDFLGDSIDSNFDPFAQSPHGNVKQVSNNNPTIDFFSDTAPKNNGRRSSAQEIQQDFAGLTFEIQDTKTFDAFSGESNKDDSDRQDLLKQQVDPVPEAITSQPLDPWATSLVDLNLRGDKTVQLQKRTSGPSLDNLLVGSNTKRPSGGVTSFSANELISSLNDPFGAPTLLPPTNTYRSASGPLPPSAPSYSGVAPRPPNPALAISSLGAPGSQQHYGQQPLLATGPARSSITGSNYGNGLGGNGAYTPGYAAGYSQGYAPGGPMAYPPQQHVANRYGVNNTRSMGSYQQQQQQQPKSSLDTLDWRS